MEIKDYLRLTADVPAYLPQAISNYFMQVVIPLEKYSCSATITSALIPEAPSNLTSLLLDIDAWQDQPITLDGDGVSEHIALRLETLRQVKNYVFESCITDATRGLIA